MQRVAPRKGVRGGALQKAKQIFNEIYRIFNSHLKQVAAPLSESKKFHFVANPAEKANTTLCVYEALCVQLPGKISRKKLHCAAKYF